MFGHTSASQTYINLDRFSAHNNKDFFGFDGYRRITIPDPAQHSYATHNPNTGVATVQIRGKSSDDRTLDIELEEKITKELKSLPEDILTVAMKEIYSEAANELHKKLTAHKECGSSFTGNLVINGQIFHSNCGDSFGLVAELDEKNNISVKKISPENCVEPGAVAVSRVFGKQKDDREGVITGQPVFNSYKLGERAALSITVSGGMVLLPEEIQTIINDIIQREFFEYLNPQDLRNLAKTIAQATIGKTSQPKHTSISLMVVHPHQSKVIFHGVFAGHDGCLTADFIKSNYGRILKDVIPRVVQKYKTAPAPVATVVTPQPKQTDQKTPAATPASGPAPGPRSAAVPPAAAPMSAPAAAQSTTHSSATLLSHARATLANPGVAVANVTESKGMEPPAVTVVSAAEMKVDESATAMAEQKKLEKRASDNVAAILKKVGPYRKQPAGTSLWDPNHRDASPNYHVLHVLADLKNIDSEGYTTVCAAINTQVLIKSLAGCSDEKQNTLSHEEFSRLIHAVRKVYAVGNTQTAKMVQGFAVGIVASYDPSHPDTTLFPLLGKLYETAIQESLKLSPNDKTRMDLLHSLWSIRFPLISALEEEADPTIPEIENKYINELSQLITWILSYKTSSTVQQYKAELNEYVVNNFTYAEREALAREAEYRSIDASILPRRNALLRFYGQYESNHNRFFNKDETINLNVLQRKLMAVFPDIQTPEALSKLAKQAAAAHNPTKSAHQRLTNMARI